MATPGTSRSGRVLKKSVKLLEMETEYKASPPARVSVSKIPKGSVSSTEAGLINISTPIINTNAIVISQDRTTPSSSNLKFKLNLSGDIKLEPNAIANISDLKMSTVPINQNIIATQNTPIKIIPALKGTVNSNAFVVKLKNDSTLDPKIITGMKRPIETTSMTLDSLKKKKLESGNQMNIQTIQSSQPTAVSIGQPTKLEFPKRIFVTHNSVKSETEQSQPFKAVLSPISQVDKDGKSKVQQSFASSTPKINTVFSSNILARSIQEQKRINQRAKQFASQQTSAAPISTPSRVSQPSRNASGVVSTSTRTVAASNSAADDEKKSSKKVSVSPYVLWCREVRSEYQSRYPDLDFVNLSRKMGEIWHTLAQNEKDIWFKKAKQLTQQQNPTTSGNESVYTQDCSDDLKPKTVSSKQTLPITTGTLKTFDECFRNGDREGVLYNELHTIGTELIDVHSYLNILGDSLETIGSYIQRGVKYNSPIEYSQSTALSTLLDTALVAMGSLSCLTRAIPQIAPSSQNMAQTIENVTYFMPPSELDYDA